MLCALGRMVTIFRFQLSASRILASNYESMCIKRSEVYFCVIVVQNDINTCNHVPFFDKQGSVSGKKFCSFAARSVGQVFQFVGLIVNPLWCFVFTRGL